jgi:hypothetical protein
MRHDKPKEQFSTIHLQYVKRRLNLTKILFRIFGLSHVNVNQPINVPAAGAQAFLMDYTERTVTPHGAQCGLVGANDCKCRDQPGPTGQPGRDRSTVMPYLPPVICLRMT